MLGFTSWTRSDREGGAKPFTNYECPYCVPVRMLRGSGAGGRKQVKNLHCDECESHFEVTPAGEVEPIIPTLAPEETTPGRRTCIALEQGRMSFDDPILCRNCQHHQNIIMQLLSAYDPSSDMNNENGEEEEATRLTQYREDLERRYPLCVTCRSRIQERLRVVEYKVRTRRLAARSSKLERATAKEPRLGRNYALAIFDALLMQGLFSTMLALDTRAILTTGDTILQLTSFPSLLEPFLLDRKTWYAACALIAIITVAKNLTISLLPCSWALFLLLLRVAMVNMIADGTIVQRTMSLGNWSLPPYVLLSLACYGLLWLLYGGDRRKKSSVRTRSADSPSLSLANSRSPSLAASRSSMSEPDVVNKFASLDTALENLGPQTPLTTRYTDLGGVGRGSSGRTSPFSVPNLQVAKKMSAVTPRSTNDLRPSVFDGARRVGLESVLEGFSIDEARPRAASPSARVGSGSIFDKIVLTIGCVMARIALNEQLALIAVLLVLTIGLRDVLWRRLPPFLRLIVNAFVLGRLFWIILLFNDQILADWPALHERVNGLEYAMDLLIVLTR